MVLQTTTPRGVSQQGAEKEPAGSDTHSAVFNPDSTIPLHSVQIPKLPDALAAADTLPPPTVPSVSFSKLFRYATRLELFLNFVGLLCAAAAGSAQPMMSLLFGNLVNKFVKFSMDPTSPDAAADFKRAAADDALILVYMGIGAYAASHVYMYIWTYTGEVNSKRIREQYLKAVLRQDIAFYDNLGPGEVATRIQTDTHLIQEAISEKVPTVCSFISAFVAGFALAYARSWRVALVLSVILPGIMFVGSLMGVFDQKYEDRILQTVADSGTLAEEAISAIRTVQAFGSQAILAQQYDSHTQIALSAGRKSAVVRGLAMGCFFFILYSAYSLAFRWGTTVILQGHADVGTVINCLMGIFVGSVSLTMLFPEVGPISTGIAAGGKIFQTIDRVPPIDAASNAGLIPGSIQGNITLENVAFHYPSRPDVPILKGISVSFQAGRTAALVGASGSGKSTVVALIERFYDPVSGVIRLDGVDVKELNIKWLRQQIGYVQQEPVLFATTIKANVAHGLIGTTFEHATDEEKSRLVRQACIKANADSFIQKLPLGYDTMVGERGFLLSGGQKQRIAIARAIVSDPIILLLDEATSALDTQSEGLVQDALDKASAGRTTITVAHRLSTIRDADQIYVLGGGEVLEHGTHSQLLANESGPYGQLVRAQALKDRHNDLEETPSILEHVEDVEAPLEEEKDTMELQPLHIVPKPCQSGDAKGRGSTPFIPEPTYSLSYLFKRMGHMASNDTRSLALGFLCAVAGGLVYPAFGVVFGKAVGSFGTTDRHELRHQGDRNALWFFIIALWSGFWGAGQNHFFTSGAAMLTAQLRSSTFRAILRQNIGWFDVEKNSTGALVSSLGENPTKISGIAGETVGAIVHNCSSVIVGAIVGLVFGPKLAAVGIACIPLLIGAGYIRLRIVVQKEQQNRAAHEESAQLACEAAGAVRTVQALTREDSCLDEYSRHLDVPLRTAKRSAIFSTGLFAISQSMAFFCISLVFWYGSRLVADLELSTFHFFVCLMAVVYGAIQAGSVFNWVPDIAAAKGAATGIIQLLDRVPSIDSESSDGFKVDDQLLKGRIHFQDVHFLYPTRADVPVLRGLSLVVEPGTFIALVGPSGCGKSTIVQLLERFYDPLAGHILLDGTDISTINVQSYRAHLGLVSQEPTLYAGTIRFNILLGATRPHSQITEKELEDVCRAANILEFVQSLPLGFETQVGGKGSQLSGGQKQRIAIARALIRNPKVLLLDEATSALDSQSERVVQTALDNAARGRTTIAIAHRLSTIQNADCIYFIQEGRVTESGTHDELLRRKGGYYELVQLQALSAD